MGYLFLTVLLGSSVPDSLSAIWAARMDSVPVHHIICNQRNDWPLAGETFERRVEFWFVRPNRFRADYEAPDRHTVIADGQTVWTIVPDNAQVLVQSQESSLTWRDTMLGDLLSPHETPCHLDTLKIEKSDLELLISCDSLTSNSPWTRVAVTVQSGRTWPTRVVLEDISENITEYKILLWDEPPYDSSVDSLFVAERPDGYEVIRVD